MSPLCPHRSIFVSAYMGERWYSVPLQCLYIACLKARVRAWLHMLYGVAVVTPIFQCIRHRDGLGRCCILNKEKGISARCPFVPLFQRVYMNSWVTHAMPLKRCDCLQHRAATHLFQQLRHPGCVTSQACDSSVHQHKVSYAPVSDTAYSFTISPG